MTILITTVGITLLFFVLFLLGLSLGRLLGRKKERRCACAEAKVIMRKFEQREAQARQAAAYRSDSVDLTNLPLLEPEE